MLAFRFSLIAQFVLLSFLAIFLALNNEAVINSLVTEKVPDHSRSPLVSKLEVRKPKIKRCNATKVHAKDYITSEHLDHTHANASRALNTLNKRDYTCGPGNPCSNGACCGASGFCGYGILRLHSCCTLTLITDDD